MESTAFESLVIEMLNSPEGFEYVQFADLLLEEAFETGVAEIVKVYRQGIAVLNLAHGSHVFAVSQETCRRTAVMGGLCGRFAVLVSKSEKVKFNQYEGRGRVALPRGGGSVCVSYLNVAEESFVKLRRDEQEGAARSASGEG